MTWQFLWEGTDRVTWPSHWGTVVVLADDFQAAFTTAFAMAAGRKGVQMVTSLELVL